MSAFIIFARNDGKVDSSEVIRRTATYNANRLKHIATLPAVKMAVQYARDEPLREFPTDKKTWYTAAREIESELLHLSGKPSNCMVKKYPFSSNVQWLLRFSSLVLQARCVNT